MRGLLTDDQRAQFEAALGKLGMPVESFDRFEPWYASLMFALIPLTKAGIVGDNGVEKGLDAAAGTGKKHVALETVEYQLSIFDSLPREAQIDYMMKTIEGSDDIKALLEAMMAEWLEGDADSLARLMNEDMEGEEALMDRLLWQRNRQLGGVGRRSGSKHRARCSSRWARGISRAQKACRPISLPGESK